jgi:5-methylcytosine-specific restriction endonuclease McrA
MALDRRYLSQKKRAELVLAQGGRCAMCGNKLQPGHIEFDHIQALEHDGDNAPDNWRAICASPCHKMKTRTDHQARGKRDRIAVGGRQKKGPPMAGSRASRFKRCMDGTVVAR